MHIFFRALTGVKEMTQKWMQGYNECCPHHSFRDMSPDEYRTKYQTDNKMINLLV